MNKAAWIVVGVVHHAAGLSLRCRERVMSGGAVANRRSTPRPARVRTVGGGFIPGTVGNSRRARDTHRTSPVQNALAPHLGRSLTTTPRPALADPLGRHLRY